MYSAGKWTSLLQGEGRCDWLEAYAGRSERKRVCAWSFWTLDRHVLWDIRQIGVRLVDCSWALVAFSIFVMEITDRKWNIRATTGLSCLSILSRSSSSSCSPEALTQPSKPLATASSHFPLCPGHSGRGEISLSWADTLRRTGCSRPWADLWTQWKALSAMLMDPATPPPGSRNE